jgi:maltose phosphorylase
MSVVKGFGGLRVKDGKLHFNPFLPDQWKSYSFRVEFRNHVIKIKISADGVKTELESGDPLEVFIKGQPVQIK